jgi:hypothetical protein
MDPIPFVEQHGVVLVGGRGPRPNLADAVADEPILGSWWGHKNLRGHIKSGQRWSLQNRPTEVAWD